MRESFTAVIERNAELTDRLATEPYECAWASEARWFVRVMHLEGGGHLSASVQVSPDGLHWCNEGAALRAMDAPGLYSLPVRDFGGWLRLDCTLRGRAPRARVMIYLALKE